MFGADPVVQTQDDAEVTGADINMDARVAGFRQELMDIRSERITATQAATAIIGRIQNKQQSQNTLLIQFQTEAGCAATCPEAPG